MYPAITTSAKLISQNYAQLKQFSFNKLSNSLIWKLIFTIMDMIFHKTMDRPILDTLNNA